MQVVKKLVSRCEVTLYVDGELVGSAMLKGPGLADVRVCVYIICLSVCLSVPGLVHGSTDYVSLTTRGSGGTVGWRDICFFYYVSVSVLTQYLI